MLNVGLTGNIASGKSTVAARFAALGAAVLDADTYAREAVAPGTAALSAIVARFGSSILRGDGALDRQALGRVVFADATARRDLEAIVHPEVARRRAAAADAARARGEAIAVADVPLLFEAGLGGEFDAIVLVDAPEAARLERLVRTRGIAEADARAMMAAQDDARSRRDRADFVIDNVGSLDALERRVDDVWRELQRRAGGAPGRPE
jgi:dephospho-CoA kinase